MEPPAGSLIERLRQSERRLQTIIDAEPACVKIVSAEGVLLEMNRAGLAMLEATDASEVLGRPVVNLVHPEDQARFLDAHRAAARGGRVTVEFRMLGLKGTQRWLEMHAVAFEPSTTGAPSSVLSVTHDITERKMLEEQLRQSQKLHAVGRLAGGIAHDFNNLSTAILGFCDLAIHKLTPDHPAHEEVLNIRDAAQRGVTLIQQLLAFSRKQMLDPRVLDLNLAVRHFLTILPRVIGEDISLETDLDPALLRITADPTQIDQILMNLAANARDAMPAGGSLQFLSRNVDLQSSPVPRINAFRPGSYVKLVVSDTGLGMNHDTLAQIFEPFFTTSRFGEGTGLGLSTVYGIVKQSDGYITVHSTVGSGTAFTIYFPATTADADAAMPVAPPAEPARVGTVLVVEDSGTVREFVRRTLENAGHRVLTAGNAQEAIQVARHEEGRLDLVLTDVIMPGLAGPQLIRELRREWQQLRHLYMTGYAEREVVGPSNGSAAPMLRKPFTTQQLLSAVSAALGDDTVRVYRDE